MLRRMTARVLLGIVAALRAVLIPGEAGLMTATTLEWPRRLRRPELTAAVADLGTVRAQT
jgi:hypothetical protein